MNLSHSLLYSVRNVHSLEGFYLTLTCLQYRVKIMLKNGANLGLNILDFVLSHVALLNCYEAGSECIKLNG